MSQKKYASLQTLQKFLDNLKNLFATKGYVDAEVEKTKNVFIYIGSTGKATMTFEEILAAILTGKTVFLAYDYGNKVHFLSIYGMDINNSLVYFSIEGFADETFGNIIVGIDAEGNVSIEETVIPTAYEVIDFVNLFHNTDSTAHSDIRLLIGNLTSDLNDLTSVIDNHNTDSTAHNDIRLLIEDLTTRLNALADSDDTTLDQLSEIVAYIKSNKSLIEGVTTNKVNVSDIIDNLTTSVSNKPLSAAQGVELKSLIDSLSEVVDSKAEKTHFHVISDVADLQSALDEKASSTHNHKVTDISDLTATATELNYMDGVTSNVQTQLDGKAPSTHSHTVSQITGLTTSVEELNYVDGVTSGIQAQLDGKAATGHKHAISDVTNLQSALDAKAAQTSLNTHTSDKVGHITSAERTNWGAAYTHSQAAHAPSNAEKNQNAFSNVKIGNATIEADTSTDTLVLSGTNITIAPDVTTDGIAFSVADGSTSVKGLVKLEDSVTSTSTTTAATPKSVKSAYDLASSAKSIADDKADKSHKHTVSDISNLTATATELNYVKGVTSSIQTQLDGKADKSHTHTITASASDDDIVVLTGTNGTNGVTYSASHAQSGVTAGTYKSVTVNAYGHVTAGSNPTTISGYGITDAYTKTQVDSALSGKSNSGHSHAIADVSGLQSALDGKAAASHGTHVEFDSTNTPKMDGTAAFGTSTRVARADHVHPTDTSRASKTEFDAHVADTTKHITSTERTNWNAAYTHSQTAHAPSNAEKNQNAFSNVKVGSTTVAADTATDTLTLVAGTNVQITADANGDSITISATDTKVTVDSALSTTSPNPVRNSVVSTAINSATEAIGLNTQSIAAHNTAITNLQNAVAGITEITSQEIINLFSS